MKLEMTDEQIREVAERSQEMLNAFVKEKELDDYLKESSGAYVGDWWENIKLKKDSVAIPTGFQMLDEKLDGGLYDGLYTFGAVSSLGKTTFLLQIFDQLASKGYDVMIFSLEMSRDELIAKSISRITYGLDKERAKTVRQLQDANKHDFFDELDFEVVEKAKENYIKRGKHIFIQDGLGDITVHEVRDRIKKHVELTGRKPIVLIDYLQILAPYSEKMGDKQNIDRNVLELKRISRDFVIPVVVVSSFSRAAYNTEVSMASFKEAGSIEYTSDVLVGLQPFGIGTEGFNMEEFKNNQQRKIELVVLKNRNGITGVKLDFVFHSKYNFYRESYFDRQYLGKQIKEKSWRG